MRTLFTLVAFLCLTLTMFAGPALADDQMLDEQTRFLLIHGSLYTVQGDATIDSIDNADLLNKANNLTDKELITQAKKNLEAVTASRTSIKWNPEVVAAIKARVPELAIVLHSAVDQMTIEDPGEVGILASTTEKTWSVSGKSALGATLYTYYLRCQWSYDGSKVLSYTPNDWGRIVDPIWNYDSDYDDADYDYYSSNQSTATVYREGHFYNFWAGFSQHDYPWHNAKLFGSGTSTHTQGINYS